MTRTSRRPRRRLAYGLVAAAAVLVGCGPVATAGPGCRLALSPTALPADLRESSGVAASADHPGIFWTHQDAGSSLFAVDQSGATVRRLELPAPLRDWEDLALARCGPADWCLYAADVGDNYEERPHIALVRFTEPRPDADEIGPVEVFSARLPDGPRDIEALLVMEGERILLVTKGRNHPITVYRYPGEPRPDTVVLEEVQRLSDSPRILPRQVTGGAVAPDGRTVVLRTYQSLQFYVVVADTLVPAPGGLVNLRTLQEPQGEGVALTSGGLVVLTSEGGPGGGPGSLAMLRCTRLGG